MHFSKLIILILLVLVVSCNKSDSDKADADSTSDPAADSSACAGPHSGPVVDQSDFENRINLMYTSSPDRGCISFANYDFTPQIRDYRALSESDKRELYATIREGASSFEAVLSSYGLSYEDFLVLNGASTTDDLFGSILTCECGQAMELPTVLAGKRMDQLDWSDVDLTGANVSGFRLSNANLSSVIGLSALQLNSVQIWGAILPEMDLTGFDPIGKYLPGVDFRNTTGLTAEMLNKADGAEVAGEFAMSLAMFPDYMHNWALAAIKYPAMDIGSLDLTNRVLQNSDFSLVTGLTTGKLNTSISSNYGIELSGVIFPSMTISGLNPSSRLANADMSRVLGLSETEYNSYSQKSGLVLPTNRDW
jgi:uncharacterized protein YjbI with pentapeptide repeats